MARETILIVEDNDVMRQGLEPDPGLLPRNLRYPCEFR